MKIWWFLSTFVAQFFLQLLPDDWTRACVVWFSTSSYLIISLYFDASMRCEINYIMAHFSYLFQSSLERISKILVRVSCICEENAEKATNFASILLWKICNTALVSLYFICSDASYSVISFNQVGVCNCNIGLFI